MFSTQQSIKAACACCGHRKGVGMRQGRGMQIEFRAAKPFCCTFAIDPAQRSRSTTLRRGADRHYCLAKSFITGASLLPPLLVTFAAAERCIRTNGVLPHHPSTRCPATTVLLFLHHLQTSERIYRSSSPMSGHEPLPRRETRHLAQHVTAVCLTLILMPSCTCHL